MICMTVLGEPVAQKRHRTVTRGRDGRPLPFAHEYDPSAGDKADLAALAQLKAPAKLLEGPLQLEIVAVFGRPKSHYRTGKHAGELKPNATLFHTTRPDHDNVTKLVCDALTGVWWTDDSRIVLCDTLKVYGRPKLWIRLQTIDEIEYHGKAWQIRTFLETTVEKGDPNDESEEKRTEAVTEEDIRGDAPADV